MGDPKTGQRLLREAQDAKSLFITNLPDGLLEARRLHFARAYWSRGEKEEALEQLRKVARRGPGDVASRLEHAKLLFSLGEIAQATEELARLAQLRTQDRLLRSYLKAGAILRELKVEEAVAQHSRTQLWAVRAGPAPSAGAGRHPGGVRAIR